MVCLFGVTGSAIGGATAPVSPAGRVSLQLEETSLKDALSRLASAGGVPIELDPEVPKVLLRVSFVDVPWETALRSVIRTAAGNVKGLVCDKAGDGYRVRITVVPASTVDVVPAAPKPLYMNRGSIDFKNGKLRQVLRRIGAETGIRTQVEPQVEDVRITLRLDDRPASELVTATLEAAGGQIPGLRFVWDGYRYIAWKCPHGAHIAEPEGDGTGKVDPAAKAVQSDLLERLSVRFFDVYQLSGFLGGSVYSPQGGQSPYSFSNTPLNNQGMDQVFAPGGFLPVFNPPVVTGMCRISGCGPRYIQEAPGLSK
jgi:hypothetical protein